MVQYQIQEKRETKEQAMVKKVQYIIRAKRVRRTSNRNIWTCGSGNQKMPKKWYHIIYDEDAGLLCSCPAFAYCPLEDSEGKPYCCHLLSIAMFEGGEM